MLVPATFAAAYSIAATGLHHVVSAPPQLTAASSSGFQSCWPNSLVRLLTHAALQTQVQQFAERYFGGWKGAPDAMPPSRASVSEPAARPQGQLGSFEEATRAGPAAVFAYYRPGVASEESTTLDVIRRAVDPQNHGTRLHRLVCYSCCRLQLQPRHLLPLSLACRCGCWSCHSM